MHRNGTHNRAHQRKLDWMRACTAMRALCKRESKPNHIWSHTSKDSKRLQAATSGSGIPSINRKPWSQFFIVAIEPSQTWRDHNSNNVHCRRQGRTVGARKKVRVNRVRIRKHQNKRLHQTSACPTTLLIWMRGYSVQTCLTISS